MDHSFDINFAKRYGLTEAIMIKNFQFWIAKNKANEVHQYDGRTWTYNSVKAFEELFPYLKPSQVRRCLESLIEQGILIKGDYNKNRYVRTSWYAFANESMFLNQQMHLANLTNGDEENDKCITDTNPDEQEKPSKKKGFVPPTEQEVLAYFQENGQTEFQAKKAYVYYAKFDWTDSQGKKVKNWKQKMLNNWFTDLPSVQAVAPLEGDEKMWSIINKGFANCTQSELKWVFEWQHRTGSSYLQYADNIRLVRGDSPMTKQDCIDADRAAGY